MNFYVETHIDRVSEDIEAFCQILDQCPPNLELNGDLSHYLYRGIKQGKGLSRVLSMVGHMHQRMAREFGGAYIHYCAGSLLLIRRRRQTCRRTCPIHQPTGMRKESHGKPSNMPSLRW